MIKRRQDAGILFSPSECRGSVLGEIRGNAVGVIGADIARQILGHVAFVISEESFPSLARPDRSRLASSLGLTIGESNRFGRRAGLLFSEMAPADY